MSLGDDRERRLEEALRLTCEDIVALQDALSSEWKKAEALEEVLRRIAEYGCGCAGCQIARRALRLPGAATDL